MTSHRTTATHHAIAGQSEADAHVTFASQIGTDTQTFSAGHFKHGTHAPLASQIEPVTHPSGAGQIRDDAQLTIASAPPTPFGLGHSTVLGRVRRANPGRPNDQP